MESEGEAARLEAKTDAEAARAQLLLTGLAPGMRALDVGAGTGAVARVMAELVGPSGGVVAIDGAPARLAAGRELARACGDRLALCAGDVYQLPIEDRSVDFVWSRFLFEYLQRLDDALAELKRVVRVGGKVVVGDVDGKGLNHYPLPAEVASGLEKLGPILAKKFDPHVGRKLFHHFRKVGFSDIRVHLLPHHVHAGVIGAPDRANWQAQLETIRPYGQLALGSAPAYDSFVAAFLGLLDDPDALTYSVLFLVEGIRSA
jgi:ubiquinone/menaquinone biosynthesis C-methylase UbiE